MHRPIIFISIIPIIRRLVEICAFNNLKEVRCLPSHYPSTTHQTPKRQMMAVRVSSSPRMSMPACIIVVFSLFLIVIDNTSSSTNRIIIRVDGASTSTSSSSVSRRRGLFGRRTSHENVIHAHDDDDEYDEYSYDRFNNNFFNKNDDNDPEVVEEEEEECVTNFYTRVRAKRRALLNGPQFDISSQLHPKSLGDDNNDDIVSLTSSYCPLSGRSGCQEGMMDDHDHRRHHQLKDDNLSFDGDSSMARSVRGGSSSATTTARRPASRSSLMSEGNSFWGMRPQCHSRIAANDDMEEDDKSFPREGDDDLIGDEESFQDNYHINKDHHRHHCLGLLRVPCSIAINSGEDEASSTTLHSPTTSTAVSAYVDTGAQVTVISAAAAKRVGIYHLMDRRYAGRATGVGHCRVLGRIPARHVYFLLGGNEEQVDDNDDCRRYNDNEDYYPRRDVRGGGGTSYDRVQDNSSRGSVMVQMDGPALTVLEGTVTKGVDVLLGLDVLQDWEAEIRMGSNKSITVREKKRRGGASVVIPFATSSTTKDAGASLRSSGGVYTARSSSRKTSTHSHHDHPRRHNIKNSNNYFHDASYSPSSDDNDDDMDLIENDMDLIDNDIDDLDEEEYDEDTDYDDLFFSPTSTDIESDLDLLDKSGHEFPPYDGSNGRTTTGSRISFIGSGGDWAASNNDTNKIRRTKMTVHDEVDGDSGRNNPSVIHDEKYELDDMNDDVDYLLHDEDIDMSGL